LGNEFAKNLRRLRKERRWSQFQLGQQVGVVGSTISLYESGRREPGCDTLLRIAQIFEVSLDSLLGGAAFQILAGAEYWDNIPLLNEHNILGWRNAGNDPGENSDEDVDDAPFGDGVLGDGALSDAGLGDGVLSEATTEDSLYMANRPWRSGKFWYNVGQPGAPKYNISAGDKVLINPHPQNIEIMDLVLALLPDSKRIKIYQIIQVPDPIMLTSADTSRNTSLLTAKSLESLPVFGKILELRRHYPNGSTANF
jgi:transcriptional regulator with XRE-family HTH domain